MRFKPLFAKKRHEDAEALKKEMAQKLITNTDSLVDLISQEFENNLTPYIENLSFGNEKEKGEENT